MNTAVRDGSFDVVVAAGPHIEVWPSVGVRALSTLCAEMGLRVALFGGESITVRGVIPLPGTGGLVLVEDSQQRVHRIHARAIVRAKADIHIPDPFPGWYSPGLIPLATAQKLIGDRNLLWEPITAILGTGNRALRFGSLLLESGVSHVICIESYAQWGAKRYAGWEVERRRFEMLGGRLTEAQPIQLAPKGPMLWQLKLQDRKGVQVLDVGRVISAGPFHHQNGIREYPPGSFLFELDQTAEATQNENVEGWVLEIERGRWLAGKIIRSLVTDLGEKKEEVDQYFRRARGRLRRYLKHREAPFTPSYQGKWIELQESKKIRSFSGVPQKEHLKRPSASIECFEEVPCNLCQTACPTSAILIGKVPRSSTPILNEAACTACGKCLEVCPSNSISLMHEKSEYSKSILTLPWHGKKAWTPGEFAFLLNRRGEVLGKGRVLGLLNNNPELVQLEVPTHILWEARSIKRGKPSELTEGDTFLTAADLYTTSTEKVEITLNGEKRLVRDRIPISLALFEIGQSRPEDMLYCLDGSCGMCHLSVDSVKKAACLTKTHRGMAIKLDEPHNSTDQLLCPCLGITQAQVEERIRSGRLNSPEAVLSVTHVGEGKCHGQLCMVAFKRILEEQNIDVSQWVDWRFPWSDWTLTPSRAD